QAFDRKWAETRVREAGELLAKQAEEKGEGAKSRVELLRLKFYEGLKILEIAERWQTDPAKLHHQYATARKEFKEALLVILARCPPDYSQAALEQEAANLITYLRSKK